MNLKFRNYLATTFFFCFLNTNLSVVSVISVANKILVMSRGPNFPQKFARALHHGSSGFELEIVKFDNGEVQYL
jgi:hypothetical protein